MDQPLRGRKSKKLWVLILLGAAYSSFLHFQHTLIGASHVEGIIGVLFGLYICSHPAAHGVDMLFFWRAGQRPFSSTRSAVMWVALNMLAFLIGWTVIFLGTTRLVAPL
jgi:hypothetical protein